MRTAIVIACVLFPASAEAASLAVFDAPGAATTCGTALASDGLVAGQATAGGIGTATPFLWHGGHFSAPKLNLPPGLVYLGGVNSAHAVVGTDLTQNLQILAFSAHGSMTSTPALGRHPVLSLDGITETGTILGQVQLPVMFPKKLFNAPAFLRDAFGDVTLLDDGTGNTRPAGMNGLATAIAGTSLSQAGLRGWVYRAGQFAPVNVPGAMLTFPQGVDGSGLCGGLLFRRQRDRTRAARVHLRRRHLQHVGHTGRDQHGDIGGQRPRPADRLFHRCHGRRARLSVHTLNAGRTSRGAMPPIQ